MNINYSISFTEIPFLSESFILLQLLGIAHMTFLIKTERDRLGGQSDQTDPTAQCNHYRECSRSLGGIRKILETPLPFCQM